MNSIKFIIGIAVIGLTLAGFIVMDPAFKSSLRVTIGVQSQSLSTTPERLNAENSTAAKDNIALNFVH